MTKKADNRVMDDEPYYPPRCDRCAEDAMWHVEFDPPSGYEANLCLVHLGAAKQQGEVRVIEKYAERWEGLS
jgi:hypothetical protein